MQVRKLGGWDMRRENEWRNIKLQEMISMIRIGLIILDGRIRKSDL